MRSCGGTHTYWHFIWTKSVESKLCCQSSFICFLYWMYFLYWFSTRSLDFDITKTSLDEVFAKQFRLWARSFFKTFFRTMKQTYYIATVSTLIIPLLQGIFSWNRFHEHWIKIYELFTIENFTKWKFVGFYEIWWNFVKIFYENWLCPAGHRQIM